MSLIIGIKSCRRDLLAGFHEAIRKTWGRDLNRTPLVFFMGGNVGEPVAIAEDEVVVNSPDDYRSLPYKTKAMLQWFLDSPYDHMFLCDNDTFILPRLFLNLDYQNYDYAGKISLWPAGVQPGQTFEYNDGQGTIHKNCYSWASGGYGYFVSRKAAELIVATEPCSWAEDLWVGQALGPHIRSGEIKAHDFQPYHNHCVWHFQKHIKPFEVQEIYEAYANGQPFGHKWSVR